MAENKNNQEIDLNKYKDSDGLSIRKMNFGLWLAENRENIARAFTIFLIILSAGFFIYSSYSFFRYFASAPQSNLFDQSVELVSPRNIVREIEVGLPQVFVSDKKYDLAVSLDNPNSRFLGIFNYCFSQNEANINCGQNFILPSEKKHILALGQTLEEGQSQITFKITSIQWERIDMHTIPDWPAYLNNRLNLSFENIHFSPPSESGLSEKINLNSLDFQVLNNSSFGYYEVPLNILIFNGSELVAVNRYSLKNFLAGEKRAVNLSWPGNFRNVTQIDIRPELNILEESVFLKYQGAPVK